jgi:hypothetical protein
VGQVSYLLTLYSTARNATAVYAADGSVILEAFENGWPRILALERSSFVLQINTKNDEMVNECFVPYEVTNGRNEVLLLDEEETPWCSGC